VAGGAGVRRTPLEYREFSDARPSWGAWVELRLLDLGGLVRPHRAQPRWQRRWPVRAAAAGRPDSLEASRSKCVRPVDTSRARYIDRITPRDSREIVGISSTVRS
jgi:hypothetical protein